MATSLRRFDRSVRYAWILGAIAFGAAGCGGSDDQTIDFGAFDPNARTPRGRPYPCPPTAPPESGSVCSTRGLSCEYDRGTCLCDPNPSGEFGALVWTCPFESASETCPTAEPEAGSACTALLTAAECTYGRSVACGCAYELQTWVCWDPGDCPKTAPDHEAECDQVGMACGYGMTRCECLTTGWQCGA